MMYVVARCCLAAACEVRGLSSMKRSEQRLKFEELPRPSGIYIDFKIIGKINIFFFFEIDSRIYVDTYSPEGFFL